MAYALSTGGSSSVKATELVVSIFDQVDSAFYDVMYPEILWRVEPTVALGSLMDAEYTFVRAVEPSLLPDGFPVAAELSAIEARGLRS